MAQSRVVEAAQSSIALLAVLQELTRYPVVMGFAMQQDVTDEDGPEE